ncbi:major facilitator superfamily domain-containing protein [Lasiosphaeria miniovina]|uniref:Major facilitator superfamily domain-containing protein n=1 Tax=Lasiosphaeria miniovina TaxID=1954250 RepID=A0AA39ZYP0_9PEZI|nr:major facilitator superfamily domain-containing protein [Lasiosphaeria miniovina]KAK0705879.1 major facilitator superfamily domain-containing protein [Lasiosphaeria miniovina]
MITALGKSLFYESGLRSVFTTGRDAWLIIFSRSCRMIAYGASSLMLALFFAELDVSDSRIGLFMSLTLLGDVVLGLVLTLIADGVGRRRTLIAGSALMIFSGATFALCENYWVLLIAAVVGVISATGGDFGPFRAIEQSTISELTSPATRADVLVWYVTASSLGSSLGTELAGRIIEELHAREGWTLLDAYHACFWLYVVMGLVNMLSCSLLSDSCELKKPARETAQETEPLLASAEGPTAEEPKPPATSRITQISSETRSLMALLWVFFMIDSLADGMVSMSWTTYYMDQKFHLPQSALGDILSASYFLATCSTIFAGPLARHIGLVNTMVFTHIPSSAAVLFFPLPQSVPVTVALLLLRVGLNNMDQAPRTALIAAVVRPEERTAVMGITGMLRTLASTTGPSITGVLAGNGRFWIAFVAAGALRLAYDLGLFAMFINIKLHRHEQEHEPLPASRAQGQG